MDTHTFPRTDLAELLKDVVLPYKNIPKPQGFDIFTQGLARTGVEPRHIGNQCMCLADETRNNAQNASEPEYHSQEKSDADSLAVEPDLEQEI